MRRKVSEYDVVIEQDENGVYVGYVPQLPGCHTEGDDLDELMENMKEAIDIYLECAPNQISNPMKFIEVRKIALPRPSVS